jgi:hypothetical protein
MAHGFPPAYVLNTRFRLTIEFGPQVASYPYGNLLSCGYSVHSLWVGVVKMAMHPRETFRPNRFERAEAFTGALSTHFDPTLFGELQRSPAQAKKSQTELDR